MRTTAWSQTGVHDWAWTLPAIAAAVPVARRLVRRAAIAWGLAALSDTAELLASELVTNALVHGRPPLQLRLTLGVVRGGRALVCEVTDTGDRLPQPRTAGDQEESGRGLALIGALADRWGTRPTKTGKAVWACQLLPRPAHRSAPQPTRAGSAQTGSSPNPAASGDEPSPDGATPSPLSPVSFLEDDMTMLGVPQVPDRPPAAVRQVGGPVAFAGDGHHFVLDSPDQTDLARLAEQATAPLSVILQVTKRCNFDCNFCSETLQMPDPSLAELDRIRANLAGVARVFLSGGEPLLRRDFLDIVEMFAEFIIGVPTNATRGVQLARHMVGKVAYVNVGLEGPRATTNRVRGDYDQVLKGIYAFLEYGLPLSLSCVVLRSTLHALPFTYQLADAFSAGKLKLIMPLRKGNGLELPDHEFISLEEAGQTFNELSKLRSVHGWKPALRLTGWTPQTEGHMLLVEPTGKISVWPVYNAPDLLHPLGDLHQEPISEIWQRYPFKVNHYAKYLGRSIQTLPAADPSAPATGHA